VPSFDKRDAECQGDASSSDHENNAPIRSSSYEGSAARERCGKDVLPKSRSGESLCEGTSGEFMAQPVTYASQ
jgi:hypothetical protein